MRKNTTGRHTQHIEGKEGQAAIPAWSIQEKVPNPKNKKGFSLKTTKFDAIPAIPAKRGKAIKHSPNRPSPAMIIGRSNNDTKIVAFVRWQDCAGAKRRGWS